MLYFASFFAALGGLLSGFDTGVISGALLFINNEWNLSEYASGALVSVVLIGAMAGALLNGKLSDKFGRKAMMIFTAVIFILGSVFCAVSPNLYILMASRFITGFAIGIITFLAPLYLSEIAPANIRGALVSLFQLAITAGILFSYFTNAFFANFESWRLMLLFGVVPAVIFCAGVCFIPDTPRWCILSGKIDRAKNILKKMQPDIDIECAIKKISRQIPSGKEKLEFSKWLLLPLFIGIGAMFVQQWTGINTIIYFAPVILKNAGYNTDISAIYAAMGVGAVNFIMTFAAIFLTDKIGRKPLLYIGLFGMAICLFVLGCSFKYGYLLGDSAKFLALFSAMFYIMFFAASLGPVMILIVSEIFPLKVRSVMMSICMGFNFIFNFTVSFFFLPMLKHFGEFKTFALFSIISFLSIIFVKFAILETKGTALEDIKLSIGKDNV